MSSLPSMLDLERTLGLLPTMTCVMTSAFEARRGGVLVRRVMQCADEPVCIAVAIGTGHRISTLIRDSHTFALCLLDPRSKLILRKFEAREEGDIFDTFETIRIKSTAPVLARSMAALDCEVVRHYDLEADHEIYIGQVLGARLLNLPASPPPLAASEPSSTQAALDIQIRAVVSGSQPATPAPGSPAPHG